MEFFDPKTRPVAVFWDSDALLTAPPSLARTTGASIFWRSRDEHGGEPHVAARRRRPPAGAAAARRARCRASRTRPIPRRASSFAQPRSSRIATPTTAARRSSGTGSGASSTLSPLRFFNTARSRDPGRRPIRRSRPASCACSASRDPARDVPYRRGARRVARRRPGRRRARTCGAALEKASSRRRHADARVAARHPAREPRRRSSSARSRTSTRTPSASSCASASCCWRCFNRRGRSGSTSGERK